MRGLEEKGSSTGAVALSHSMALGDSEGYIPPTQLINHYLPPNSFIKHYKKSLVL